ncbi:hypothetical protein Tco_0724268 [Tanacetum coccineum]
MPVELGSFDVIIDMDWLRRYHAVIVCDEKLVQVPYGNETLTFCGNESSNGRESRLTVISCSKAQEYMAKGCQVFLAQISAKKEEDKSKGKQIKDVPPRLTKSSIYSRSLGLAACASLESKNEVCLLCEVNPKQIPAFDFICASLESILAIEDTWERERSGFAEEKVWGDIPVVTGFWGGKEDFFGGVSSLVP